MKKENASTKSVQGFRDTIAANLGAGSAVLLNLIDTLAMGLRPNSPVELVMKPGHALSLLGERVGEGGWTLPLEIAWFRPQTNPLSLGQYFEPIRTHPCPVNRKGDALHSRQERTRRRKSLFRSGRCSAPE